MVQIPASDRPWDFGRPLEAPRLEPKRRTLETLSAWNLIKHSTVWQCPSRVEATLPGPLEGLRHWENVWKSPKESCGETDLLSKHGQGLHLCGGGRKRTPFGLDG